MKLYKVETMDNTMNKCPWAEISSFHSLIEFQDCERWVTEQIQSGVAEEIEVEEPFSGISFEERWFKYLPSGEIWRLVEPDPPFCGLFEPVK